MHLLEAEMKTDQEKCFAVEIQSKLKQLDEKVSETKPVASGVECDYRSLRMVEELDA